LISFFAKRANFEWGSTLDNFHYYKPRGMQDLWKLMADIDGEISLLEGGTDLFPRMKRGLSQPKHVIDLKGIQELDYVRKEEDQHIKIGANIPLYKLTDPTLLPGSMSFLSKAIGSIGSPQIRSKGTLIGNICNASPAADSVPPLICLNSQIRVEDGCGSRYVELEGFFKGPGETILNKGQVATEVLIPFAPNGSKATFIKLGRVAKDLAIVNIAVLIEFASEQIIRNSRIVLGAVAPTTIRLKRCEELLVGHAFNEIQSDAIAEVAMQECKPISDLRATAQYRREMVGVLLKRAIKEILHDSQREEL
jgi:CO/xanthine dehydrogenase FAD-binding subunit